MSIRGRSGTSVTRPPRPSPARRRPQPSDALDFSKLFEDASDIIILNDREGRIMAANRAAREFGGYSVEDVERGMHLSTVLPPHEYEAAMILTQRAFDELPVPEVYEREVVLRDGSRRFVESRSNVLRRKGQPPVLQTIVRDITEKKEAAALQAALLQISQALLTAQSLGQLGQVICEEARRVLQVDGAYLWLREGDELTGFAAAGEAAKEFLGVRRPLTDSLVGQFYRATDVLVINDFKHSLYRVEHGGDPSVEALLAVPLRRSGAPVGVLVFTDHTNPRRFTRVLRDQALIFGAQTTVVIESALAREREEEEGRVSAALLRVTRDIREMLEESAVLPQIARSAREALQMDWTAVALWDAAKSAFRIAANEGMSPMAAEELALLDLRPTTLGSVIPALLGEQIVEIAAPRGRVELYHRWSVSSFLAVPMVRTGRVIGALVGGFRDRCGPFSARERRIAEGIAAQAAVAVENARLVEDLRRANRLKSEFLGTMSHELRTPLSAMLGYTELMREGAMGSVEPEQSHVLDRMLINGRGLLELINSTLDVNRLEAGRIAVDASDFTVHDLMAELREEFAARPAAREVPVIWPTAADVPPLYTDRGKVKVILRNLIDNALKFTPDGAVTVSVHCNRDLERVRLAVRDTGVGIPDDSLASVFDMFRQLEGGRWSSRGGVGLGLYLVRRYSELLGGTVNVQSAVGAGSTFTVDMPWRYSGS